MTGNELRTEHHVSRDSAIAGLSACCLALVLGATALAGRGPDYRYGEAWWREYESDGGTELLLHFAPPEVTARQQLRQAVTDAKEQAKTDRDLIDLGDLDRDGPLLGIEIIDPSAIGPKPVDDSNVSPDVVLDYGDKRRRLDLPRGFRKADGGGRFGGGLVCDGRGGLKVSVTNPSAAECSFRVDRYPKAAQCIFSMGGDESRVLLRPDGRLELKLRKPHGNPGANPGLKSEIPSAELERLLARDATIVSPDPVPVKQWVHVCIWNKPHPTPGGGEPWDARLKVNGSDVAWHLSGRFNDYPWLGGRRSDLVIGNNAGVDQGFTGVIDEFRVSSQHRVWYECPPLPWRDVELVRPIQFGKPWFREDGDVFHASLDEGLEYDRKKQGGGRIEIDLKGQPLDGLLVQGIRGRAWVADPALGFPRFPLNGMNAMQGAIEFWLRPVNWDDVTGYWHHSPPKQMHLSVARVYARDKRTAQIVVMLDVRLPRAYNLERQRIPLDPGHWSHLIVGWGEGDLKRATLYREGRGFASVSRAKPEDLPHLEPVYVEFGISDQITVMRRQVPLIEIDEVVGYDYLPEADEMQQAHRRWMGQLDPIQLYQVSTDFSYSLQRLTFSLVPKLPAGVTADSATVSLVDVGRGNETVLGPFQMLLRGDRFDTLMNDGRTVPYGQYRFDFAIRDVEGNVAAHGAKTWDYQEEPWRHCRAGILDATPPPWTPIELDVRRLKTRMTEYALGDNGLPTEILADGVNILSGPVQLLEDGKPMAGQLRALGPARNVEADWEALFTGRTCDIVMDCHAEYDGMVKITLCVTPKGEVAPVTMTFPIHAENATRFAYHPVGARGVRTGRIPEEDGIALSSRAVFKDSYGFFGHMDVNDMNRGLWWFCDNAAGWWQSKDVPAIEINRAGDVVSLNLNLIAEPTDYDHGRPIVFAILPHPARPLPTEYRLFERVDPKINSRASAIFDAFRPWPMDPRVHSMKLWPAADPANPDAGPSWEYAESCIPSMRSSMPTGLRTMYLSKAWFSCRAGAYDGWEWRSGGNSAVSLTPWFVNYLCWEMNEWIGRGIWDAIYLDECYEHPARNLDAGFSVRLPDGAEQPGVTNFQFRELMKRWRSIFHQHGKAPVLIGHHTYSWQYHGLVYCDACLDGENRPIVSLRGGDWIDKTGKTQFEVVQNCRLWGMASFYMPFIAEGGFDDKTKSQFPKWQWRMARQAQSQFAHYEVATVYEGQGSDVYKRFWRDVLGWGAGDPAAVSFHPYWDNAEFATVDGQGEDTLVSFYRRDGAILLIASNRRKEPVTARICLALGELGLGTRPRVAVTDSSFEPPEGEDPKDIQVGKTPAASLDGDDKLDVEDILLGEDGVAAREAAAYKPKLEGNTLVLPIRPRDFRMVSLQP